MAVTLRDEVSKILNLAGIGVENPVLSCNEGDPSRTDDDTCQIDQIDWEKYIASKPDDMQTGHHETTIRVDDVFMTANTLNLARHASPDLDNNNYFFRVDTNAVFYRRESVGRNDLGEGGMLFRSPGSLQWQQLDLKAVAASPALKAAVVPILLRLLGGHSEYDRLNGAPHHGDDYGYAQARAVVWLNTLIPKDDSNYRQALLRAFPTMNADGQFFAWYRFQSEDRGADIAPALATLVSNPERREMAKALLHQALPQVSSEDLSNERVVRPRFAWEGFGGVYLPLPIRKAPENVSWHGETEPVGSYVAAGAGMELFLGPRIESAQRQGLRIGVLAEAMRVLNGFGFYSLNGKIFAGNENIVGYVEGGLNIYPTGGFMGEGNYGDIIYHPNLGAGARVIPHLKYFPLSILGGLRLNPTEPSDIGFLFGLGGAQ